MTVSWDIYACTICVYSGVTLMKIVPPARHAETIGVPTLARAHPAVLMPSVLSPTTGLRAPAAPASYLTQLLRYSSNLT